MDGFAAKGVKYATRNQFKNGDEACFVYLPKNSFTTLGLTKLPEGRTRLTIKTFNNDYICRNTLISCASDVQLKIMPHMGPMHCSLDELDIFKKLQKQETSAILKRKKKESFKNLQILKLTLFYSFKLKI